jgi:hypothetical protein
MELEKNKTYLKIGIKTWKNLQISHNYIVG